jgi:hypothetical protein
VGPQCERPACAEPATVAYGFDPTRCVAWLAPLESGGIEHGRLCRRHADAMVVPRGWWLDDRRVAERLFVPPTPIQTGARPARRPGRAAAIEVAGDGPAALLDAEQPAASSAIAPAEPDITTPMPWTPVFVAGDDLDGVLDATSPLLSRAFGRVKGRGTRARPPA